MIGSRARVLLAAAVVAGGAVSAVPAGAIETVWGGKACNFRTQGTGGQYSGTLQVGPLVAPAAQSITIQCIIQDSNGQILVDAAPIVVPQGQSVVLPISYTRQPIGLTRLQTNVTIQYITGVQTTYNATQPNCTNIGLTDTRGQNFITITRITGQTIGIIDPGCF